MPDLPDYDSPAALKTFLEVRGMAMQKKFGQNFLVNGTSRQRLIDALELQEGQSVWEIGPGLGAMTAGLLTKKINLSVFEIDRGFISVLKDLFSESDNFSIIEGDVLRTWKKAIELKGIPDRFFGNLPYNIAAVIIADTISAGVRFDRALFTIQKEVAQRMTAKPGTEDYSSFSVLCQWAYDVAPVMDLAPGCFWPRPNVTSRAVVLNKKEQWPQCDAPGVFLSLLRGLFSSRRKTVKNNFSAWLALSPYLPQGGNPDDLARELLQTAGIDPASRAETFELQVFLRLADTVYYAGQNK